MDLPLGRPNFIKPEITLEAAYLEPDQIYLISIFEVTRDQGSTLDPLVNLPDVRLGLPNFLWFWSLGHGAILAGKFKGKSIIPLLVRGWWVQYIYIYISTKNRRNRKMELAPGARLQNNDMLHAFWNWKLWWCSNWTFAGPWPPGTIFNELIRS